MTHRWISTAALILIALTSLPLEATNDKKHRRAPGRENADEYIVALEVADAATAEEISALAGDVAAAYQLAVDEIWAHAGAAFFTRMSSEHADTVSSDARVKYVEANVEWELSSVFATDVDPKTCDPTLGVHRDWRREVRGPAQGRRSAVDASGLGCKWRLHIHGGAARNRWDGRLPRSLGCRRGVPPDR